MILGTIIPKHEVDFAEHVNTAYRTAASQLPLQALSSRVWGGLTQPALGSTMIPHHMEFERLTKTEASLPHLINKGKRDRENQEYVMTGL